MLWTDAIAKNPPTWFYEEEPLRAELFSAQQMAQHGEALARAHRIQSGRIREAVLTRLTLNERVLADTVRLLSDALRADRAITPAGEWLLDNYYLIDENIRTARRHLPKGYSNELPQLAEGSSAGLPRVYDIALEAIAHGDGRVDQASMQRFIAAYQTAAPLALGELWAVPIMLRLALIENLRRVAARVATGRMQRNLANSWADQMLEVAAADPKNLIVVVADMARSNPPSSSAFVAELSRRLKGQGQALLLPLTWIDQHLAEQGLSIEQLVQAENQHQAADQVSISNSINSLRLLSVADWTEFVEELSAVEATLRRDPAATYAGMDFASRDRYRHRIETLAKRNRLREQEVVDRVLELAGAAAQARQPIRQTHVGYYLIDDGLAQLEASLGVRALSRRIRLGIRERGLLFFAGVAAVSVLLAAAVAAQAQVSGQHGFALFMIGVLALLAGSQLAITAVNRLATMLTEPAPLPRMDFSKGIPEEFRALVVVPTLLQNLADVERLVESLEVRFLANRDEAILFALLTDFGDASSESLPGDALLVEEAAEAISALNRKYADDAAPIFFLFHRPRRFNPHEGVWMGHERKRGKLADLNALLLEGHREPFSRIEGDTAALAGVRYVITLDTDTQLPRDAARRLVATMAHILNQPAYDAETRRIDIGYGVMQPRVAVTLVSAHRSRYARMNAGDAGIDPYTRAVSDVYQDVFGQGSFTGKGIYDVAAFEQVLKGAMPENHVLSHDLLEGCYVRSGLTSDIELYEDYPSRYLSDIARRHRWIRGDWQIGDWLLPRVSDQAGQRVSNPISALSAWKIFDNLRRSLVPPALLALTVGGWLFLQQAWWWTLALLVATLLPAAASSLFDILRRPEDIDLARHARFSLSATATRFTSALFQLTCLPFEAFVSIDAILRTLGRMLFTHRHLLQWVASSEVDRRTTDSLLSALRKMWFAPLLAIAVTAGLALAHPQTLWFALPILGLWFASPLIAWAWSTPLTSDNALPLSADDRVFLRDVARRTWAFFERFVSEDDNWLPPDNFQESPSPVIAHRTSPTNIGLALLANLAAWDFGYASAGRVLERTRLTFATLRSLAREYGHFYNWYDTQSLRPLQPMYISSVDSGNFAASLLVLQAGLLETIAAPLVAANLADGLRDTWSILRTHARIDDDLSARVDDALTGIGAARNSLPAIASGVQALITLADQVHPGTPAGNDESIFWIEALRTQCRDVLDEIVALAGWAMLEPVPGALQPIVAAIGVPTLAEVDTRLAMALAALRALPETVEADLDWIAAFARECDRLKANAAQRMHDAQTLASDAEAFARMDFRMLYDRPRHLFSVGYHAADRRLDQSYYDLLASEARLTTFFAIAQGQVPQDSWYALGRLLTETSAGPALISWSGSMFEYLMPMLVTPAYDRSLLKQSCCAAVRRQIDYGVERGVPWGISESGYCLLDASMNYQYRAFGVPGLGLKRGLSEDLVIAPYATLLALLVLPHEACQNLSRLVAEDMYGRYGFYEARDYTASRMRRGETSARVSSFMAHHQGMGLLALLHALHDRPMQRRFESLPQFQSALHLLQERIPRATPISAARSEMVDGRARAENGETPIRVYTTGDTQVPGVQMLSNGRYHVMLTNAGGGYSRWHDLAVTRWREDGTRDPWGLFCFLRDVEADSVWSATYQPMLIAPDTYEATFAESRVEFRRRDGQIETHTDVSVSPEDDIELRRIKIINRSRAKRTIELTTYAEVVIAPPAGDAAQRGFSNLFVQTEIVPRSDAIVCSRRPRSNGEKPPWMLHLVKVRRGKTLQTSFETDRARFLGRGNGLAEATALGYPGTLSDTSGAVLDPIAAVRHRIVLDPDQTITIDVVCGVAADRDACLALIDKYQDKALSDRVFDLAWTHSQVALRQANLTEADAQLFGRLASRIIHAHASLRADAALIASNRRNQTGLWGYAISGDLPILLLKIRDSSGIDLARQLVQAHTYWRTRGLMVDLVIWNDDRGGYRQMLHDQIMGLLAASTESNIIDRPGGIFVRPVDQISPEDRILLQAVARIVIDDEHGALLEQVRVAQGKDKAIPKFVATRVEPSVPPSTAPAEASPAPLAANGFGGFSADGSEYVITTSRTRRTPLPWVNVLANPQFGSVVSESGSAYTWAENAHEFRLTPWQDDPVSDASGEMFYLRDEETGRVWSPTPQIVAGNSIYTTRHGFGYSVFEHVCSGVQSELWMYVDLSERVKYCVLRLRNQSGATRRLSASCYVELVLGDLRSKSAMHIVTSLDPQSGAILARNAFNPEFPERVAFLDVDDPHRTVTGDRAEFIGRNGSRRDPAALRRMSLSGKTGAAMDPCAAIQVPFELGDGKSREIIFRLGAADNVEQASALVLRCRRPGTARDALVAVRTHWQRVLGAVRVETPNPSLNLLANGWLLYQVIASRIWGRSGYYQSGGAWGFRDQLQDAMALVHSEPAMLRTQLLLCASRQFVEGDVQHWWHPPTGRGVRTRCSDDYLWLPYAACRYIETSGDVALLQQSAPFLSGRELGPDEESYYDLPGRADGEASLYEHCRRAIVHGLRFGAHGLPLMGSGDWNDGMNNVGIHGKGE
ncbi:MAG: glucoamylase family protein, partial [Rudaea sp.]